MTNYEKLLELKKELSNGKRKDYQQILIEAETIWKDFLAKFEIVPVSPILPPAPSTQRAVADLRQTETLYHSIKFGCHFMQKGNGLHTEELSETAQGMIKFANVLASAFQPVATAALKFADVVEGVFKTEYQNAGSPYGETDEDFRQWLKEINKEIKKSNL